MKSLATSMAVGGALAGFDRVLDIQAVNPGNARLPVLANDNWLKVAQRVAGQSVISSGLTTVINGGSFQDNFSKALLASLGDQLNAEGAGLIGDNGAVLGEPGRVLSHAVVSGISAEIAGGSAKGAAVGALAAEGAGIVMQSTLFEPQYLNENERQLGRLQEALNGSEAKAQTARFVGALAGAISTHTPEGTYSAAKSGELVYRYNMTEHMLEQFALEQQLDTLAAEKGDSDAAIRVAGRRDAMAAVVIVGSGGLAAMVGGTVIAATAPEMILAARLALAGCKSNPVLCLNQAGIYAADIAAPEAAVGSGSLLAGSTILVGKSQEEAVQFGRQVVAASANLLKDGKANQGKLGEFIAGKGVVENNALGDIPKEASVKINPLNPMSKVDLLDENGGSVNVSSPVKFFISKGQQNKHIPGTNEYKISTDAGLSKSVLTVEPESLLTKLGTGQQVGNAPIGTPGSKERINYGKNIGNYIDPQTGISTPTTNGVVHYGKNGVHIVPARPTEK